MHLSKPNELFGRHSNGRSGLGPPGRGFSRGSFEHERPGREDMRSALEQRLAPQRSSPSLLRPTKLPTRLWQGHSCPARMRIIGLGLDATEIDRIELAIERYGDRFVNRIFTAGEIAYAKRRRNPAPHFAGRFAAKEAAMKALGTGHSQGVLWRDIEVVRAGGPPQLRFYGGAARRFEAMQGTGSLLTITHSETLALAHVLLLGSD